MPNYLFRTGKIVTTQKLSDRFLKLRVVQFPPKKELGTLYFMIEILSPWFPSTEIGENIINTIAKSFFESPQRELAERFEDGIKKANQILNNLAPSEKKEWVVNLNGIAAAIQDQNIHLTSCGSAKAFLFRRGLVNPILEEEKGRNLNQIFSNLVSGEIEPGDKIFLTNQEIFNFLKLDELQKIITSFDPVSAVNEIGNILKKQKAKAINSIIIELVSEEKSLFKPPVDLPETFYLDKKQDGWLAKIIQKSKPKLSKFSGITEGVFGKIPKIISPFLKKFVILVGFGILAVGRFFQQKYASLKKTKREKAIEKIRGQKIPKDWDDFLERPQEPAAKQGALKGLGLSIVNFIKSLFQPQRRKLLYLFLILLVILALVLGIIKIRSGWTKPNPEAEKIILMAQEKQKEADIVKAVNKKDQARNLYLEALTLLEPLKNDPKVKNQVAEILTSIQSSIDEIDNIIRVSELKTISNCPDSNPDTQISQIFQVDLNLYFADSSSNKISKVQSLDSSCQNPAEIPQNAGKIETGALFQNWILWQTSENLLFQFNLENEQVSEEKIVSGNWQKAQEISTYDNNIYFLAAVDHQVYKYHLGSNGWLSQPATISAENQDLSQIVSMAIDGYIYLIKADGKVMKFLAGKPVSDFNLKNLPPPNDNLEPIKIKTNPDLDSLYILDNAHKRIVEFSKDGEYQKQYLLPNNLQNLKDLIVSPENRTIYLLADNTIYQLTI